MFIQRKNKLYKNKGKQTFILSNVKFDKTFVKFGICLENNNN